MSTVENELQTMLNIPMSITLNGQEFKVSRPSLKDLGEAQQYVQAIKKENRKKFLREKIELISSLPKDMPEAEKKELVDSILVPELSPKEKAEIISSFPVGMAEEEKQKRLSMFVIEKDGTEWAEALYILYKCIKKNHPEVTREQIEDMVTISDLKAVLTAITPQENPSKNVMEAKVNP